MSGPWLSIVGLGEDGLDGLTPAARALVDIAEVLVGGERHLAMLPNDNRERLHWPSPFDALVNEIQQHHGRPVCVLATGDPNWYGVGAILAKHLPRDEMRVVPAPSAFSLVCARLGWSLAEVDTLSLHGRPIELLQPFVQPGARLVMLGNDRHTPSQVASLLVKRHYEDSRITVLEHLGGARERVFSAKARDWMDDNTADFNTVAVECLAAPDAALLPRTAGLPDEAFEHDGQLTKHEVRAVTLAALGPVAGQLLWDVGAGAGSVAIEWMRASPRAGAVAIERDRKRVAQIGANAHALGTPILKVVEGDAPSALRDLVPPHAIFIGGGITTERMFETCWQALRPGGRLVANTVTLEGEQALVQQRRRFGGELVRIAISRAEPIGNFSGWQPHRPVTQLAVTKR